MLDVLPVKLKGLEAITKLSWFGRELAWSISLPILLIFEAFPICVLAIRWLFTEKLLFTTTMLQFSSDHSVSF